MTILDRVKKLNIFSRIRVLEQQEEERDKALELMLVHLEAMQNYVERRTLASEQQNVRLSAVVGYNLDIQNDLDVT